MTRSPSTNLRCLLMFAMLLTVASVSIADPPPIAQQNGFTMLVFEDDFSDGRLSADWKKQYQRDGEPGDRIRPYIRPQAVTFQSDFETNPTPNRLVLRAYCEYSDRRQQNVDKWFVGAIDTRPRLDENPRHEGFEHRYGYIESRIRFQTQPGQGSAFWLNSRWNKPQNWRGRGSETASNAAGINEYDRDFNVNFGNEVDIVECLKHHTPSNPSQRGVCGPVLRGNQIDASRCLIMNIHWGGGPHNNVFHDAIGQHVAVPNGTPDLIGHYHLYGLLWRRDRYEFYLDGVKMWETDNSDVVSQRPAFLFLSTGVRDSSFVGTPPQHGYGTRENTNAKMEVDWVRWWSDTPRRPPAPR